MPRLLLALLLTATALVASAGDAWAFCRTTTCKCNSEKTCDTDCPKDENGCKTTGIPISWTGKCVGFSLNIKGNSNLSADQWTDALVQSFTAWAAVDCGDGKHPSIDLKQLRDVVCDKSEFNKTAPNINVIYFSDTGWSGKDIDGTLATTKVHFNESGEILDADIAINSARHDFTVNEQGVSQDLVSVMTHEAGHFLGLDHSSDPDAVMYFQYSAGSVNRELRDDDRKAICTLYPPGRGATCDPTPLGGFGDTCPDTKVGCTVSPARGSESGSLVSVAFGIIGLVGLRAVGKRWRMR